MMVQMIGGPHDGQRLAVPNVPGRPPPLVLYASAPAPDEPTVIGNTLTTPGQLRYSLHPGPGPEPRYYYEGA